MARILIIDDDPLIRKSLGKCLQMQHHQVTTADDGQRGLAAAAANKPDLIICDFAMPTLNGHGVLAALRRDRQLEDVPFIFFSGCATREQVRHSMNLGGDDFIAKPAEVSEIVEAVNSRLVRCQRQRQRHEQEIKKAVEIFAGIVHDLGSPDAGIRWLAEAATKDKAASRPNPPLPASETKSGVASTFLANTAGRQHFVKLSEVKAIIADGEYSLAYWGKDQHMMFRKALKDWETELPSQHFIRIHRKGIVNLLFLDYVEKSANGKPVVHIRDFPQTLEVSQRKIPTLNRALKNFTQTK